MNAFSGTQAALAPGCLASGMVALPIAQVLATAQLHEQAGRLGEARSLLDRILGAAPRHAEALHLAAVVAHKDQRPADALGLMQRALAHGTNTPLYQRNIAELYRVEGRLEEAEQAARRAVALGPADPVAALNLGIVLADLRRTDEAVTCLERALALAPDSPVAHFGLAEALLGRGDLTRGWEEYEWRFRLPGAGTQLPKLDCPQWDGKPLLDGTLLLYADQGFGDGIQFGRYLPWVTARCGDVALACSAALKPLLAQIHPGLRVITNWRQAGPCVAWCPLSGLPRLAGTTLDSIPRPTAYLHADVRRASRWRTRLDGLVAPGLRRVGLVWAGRPTHKNDRRRSATLAALAPVAGLDGIALVVLQKGPAQAQVAAYRGRAPLVHLSTEIADFEDTMAIIDGLDVVVTVDTSVAHLAGAMGKPVWIMLPHAAEWRWLQHRCDSPWYPSARLFRQARAGDWAAVAFDVAAELSLGGSASS